MVKYLTRNLEYNYKMFLQTANEIKRNTNNLIIAKQRIFIKEKKTILV